MYVQRDIEAPWNNKYYKFLCVCVCVGGGGARALACAEHVYPY
jgi:hypothetical protein